MRAETTASAPEPLLMTYIDRASLERRVRRHEAAHPELTRMIMADRPVAALAHRIADRLRLAIDAQRPRNLWGIE